MTRGQIAQQISALAGARAGEAIQDTLQASASEKTTGTSTIASSFGAAGSVVIVLIWIYYSSCILFFGAEFTKVYARKFGSGIVPNSRGVIVSDLLQAKLGSTSTPR